MILRLIEMYPEGCQIDGGTKQLGNAKLGSRWPLHWAIQHELFDVAMGLLERGNDPLAVDSAGRTALDIATGSPSTQLQSWARNFGTFLGRYRFQRGRVAHQSSSSTVIFATDIERDDRGVAMKFMAHEEQYEREVAMRQLPPAAEDGGINGTVDGEYVTQVLHHARLDVDASQHDPRLRGCYLIVMDRADRDLVDALAHDGIAGRHRERVLPVVRDVLGVAAYFNDTLGRVHGDLKPRNIVETIREDGSSRWKAIDLDATTNHGAMLSSKRSTGFMSTELARHMLSQQRDGQQKGEGVAAAAGHDMFSAGLIVLQLCSEGGTTAFLCDQSDNLVQRQSLPDISNRWDEVKHKFLGRIPWADARDLCLWMLQDDPRNRPPSFAAVLQHPFLAVPDSQASQLPLRFPSYKGLRLDKGQLYHFFLSHNQKEAGDIAHTLFETLAKRYGLSIWYDMAATDLTVEGMAAGVRESAFFLLIVTTNVFQRPFCRREMDEAFLVGKPFVCVQEVEPRFAPWDGAAWVGSEEYASVPWVNDQWVKGPYDEEKENIKLWDKIKDMVVAQAGKMLPYRRRNFESTAMVQELLRRCHIVEDLAEPHPTTSTAATAAAAAAAVPVGVPEGDTRHVLLVYGEAFGASVGASMCTALVAQGQLVRTSTPDVAAAAAEVEGAKALVVVLTRGALSEAAPLARVTEALSRGSRIVLVQQAHSAVHSPNGWEFYGAEHTSAPPEVQEMLKSIEAVSFRAADGLMGYEADAMVDEVVARIEASEATITVAGRGGRDLREAAKDAEIARLTHEVAQLRGSAAAAAS